MEIEIKKPELYTFIILRDDKEIKTFKHQISDFAAFKYMLNCQGNSIYHALRYDGYKVQVIDEQTGEKEYWKYE